MKILLVILVLFLVGSQTRGYKQYPVSLAMAWIPGYCEERPNNDCIKQMGWDHQSLVIKGLWFNEYVQYEKRVFFNKKHLHPELLDEMLNYMPGRFVEGDAPQSQWQKQIKRHGSQLKQVMHSFGQSMGFPQFINKFFATMIKYYKKLNAQKLPKAAWTLDELADHMNIRSDNLQVKCNKDKSVREIQVCYKLANGALHLSKCYQMDHVFCDTNNLIFEGWRKTNQQRVIDKVVPSYYDANFAVSWIAGQCLNRGPCNDDLVDKWDHQSFTIHGLWPDMQDSGFKKFIKNKNNKYLHDLIQTDENLYKDMWNYYPPTTKNGQDPYFLWNHEFRNHGVDYVDILKAFNSTDSQEEQKLTFFREAIKLYKKYKLTKLTKGKWTLHQFSQLLNLKPNHFRLRCLNQNGRPRTKLYEFFICLKITPQGIQNAVCKQNHQCEVANNAEFQLIDWRQSRVPHVFQGPYRDQ